MKKLYLCGPINGRTDNDAKVWRETVKEVWEGECIDPLNRDYRGRELDEGAAAEIVGGDLCDIDEADALLVYFDKPSVGTSMEVFYAFHAGKPVVIWDASSQPLSPWLIHFSNYQTRNMEAALNWLKEKDKSNLRSRNNESR